MAGHTTAHTILAFLRRIRSRRGTALNLLLLLSPLLDEEKMDADSHIAFIEATLAVYGSS